ncbi:hypothetical protein SJI19_24335 [Acerihabitans sp. TG2]|uniref:hypothetical protein n=1 Tax=Acerihabitans sp. TG2 TaxID=3096008 RepID=UPI002B223967|nr:hypothetical protein [Acerihabitans sp. TG2]MEA9393608.1 hypothetical protein [Acerihabitans sp. TG2]
MKIRRQNKLIINVLFSTCIICSIVFAVITASLITKVFFSFTSWMIRGEFDMGLNDVCHIIKLSVCGGGIMGVGMALFRLLKVKGF